MSEQKLREALEVTRDLIDVLTEPSDEIAQAAIRMANKALSAASARWSPPPISERKVGDRFRAEVVVTWNGDWFVSEGSGGQPVSFDRLVAPLPAPVEGGKP